jgi:hypothetical protein
MSLFPRNEKCNNKRKIKKDSTHLTHTHTHTHTHTQKHTHQNKGQQHEVTGMLICLILVIISALHQNMLYIIHIIKKENVTFV